MSEVICKIKVLDKFTDWMTNDKITDMQDKNNIHPIFDLKGIKIVCWLLLGIIHVLWRVNTQVALR